MARLIDVDKLMAEITEENPLVHFGPFGYAACSPDSGFADKVFMRERVLEIVKSAPTVDAVEVVHGRWIMDKLEIGSPYDGNSTMLVDIGNCSVCGYRCEMLPTMNYCPNCGAKMEGERKDNG